MMHHVRRIIIDVVFMLVGIGYLWLAVGFYPSSHRRGVHLFAVVLAGGLVVLLGSILDLFLNTRAKRR
jgi:hypothetical protein